MEQPKRRGRPPNPNKPPKVPSKYVKGVPRDFMWIYKDPLEHSMHLPFLRARAQASYRKEPWELTFEDWKILWKDRWHLRGRDPDDLCMTRDDWDLPWNLDNIIIMIRKDFVQKQKDEYAKRRGPKKEIKVRQRKEIVFKKTKVQP